MDTLSFEKLRYPIGKFETPKMYTPELLAKAIQTIETFPERLKKEVTNLTNEQLNTPYRIEMTIDNIGIPMWISIVGFIIPAILSIGLLKESKR